MGLWYERLFAMKRSLRELRRSTTNYLFATVARILITGRTSLPCGEEVRTLLDRSRFLGAYFGTELIGVLKLVYMGKVASVLYLAC